MGIISNSNLNFVNLPNKFQSNHSQMTTLGEITNFDQKKLNEKSDINENYNYLFPDPNKNYFTDYWKDQMNVKTLIIF